MINEATGLLALVISAAGVFVMIFHARSQAAVAKEWKEVAQAKAQKIGDLEDRLAHVEVDLRTVRSENDELRRLNLQYQKEFLGELRVILEKAFAPPRPRRKVNQ